MSIITKYKNLTPRQKARISDTIWSAYVVFAFALIIYYMPEVNHMDKPLEWKESMYYFAGMFTLYVMYNVLGNFFSWPKIERAFLNIQPKLGKIKRYIRENERAIEKLQWRIEDEEKAGNLEAAESTREIKSKFEAQLANYQSRLEAIRAERKARRLEKKNKK